MIWDFFRGVHVGEECSYVVFASQPIIELIEKYMAVYSRIILMDPTIQISPYGEFTHFLVIQIARVKLVDIIN